VLEAQQGIARLRCWLLRSFLVPFLFSPPKKSAETIVQEYQPTGGEQ
jgi:hypothetical protein